MKVFDKVKGFLGEQSKKNQFIAGAVILAVAGIVCRVLGVIIRIPLTNIVGNFGMGLYQMVFPLYALLLIVSSAGVPIAISKMVAKEITNDNKEQCKKILWNALVLLGVIGFALSVLFVVFSGAIASLQGNKDIWVIYVAIAPSVFLVCIISALRGYFQGLQNMVPTAVSQIVEQFVKMAVGITLALLLVKISVVMAVFGAILAVTVSEVAALVYLVITYFAHKKNKIKAKLKFAIDKKLMWEILKQSLPITAMATIFPFILVFDSLVIINLLKVAGNSGETATQLFGIQSGAVHTLINLPAVIGVALATAVVPTITSLIKKQKMDELRDKSALAVKLILVLSVFFMVFYFFFADKIIDLLYHEAFKDNEKHFRIATDLLKIESVMILLMGISQVFTAMLQASDKSKFPFIALAVGGAAKIIFELIFITTPIGIYAVSISNVICFGLAAGINTFFALRTIKIKPKLLRGAVQFGLLSALYFGLLLGLHLIMPNGSWWLVPIGAISFIVYFGMVYLFGLFKGAVKEKVT